MADDSEEAAAALIQALSAIVVRYQRGRAADRDTFYECVTALAYVSGKLIHGVPSPADRRRERDRFIAKMDDVA